MQTGTYISGIGHVALIGWVMFGGVFRSDPPPFEITEVSVITSQEFETMLAAQRAPQTSAVPVALPQPEPETAPPVAPSEPDRPAARPEPPAQQVPVTDPPPDVTTIVAPPPVDVPETAPQLPQPPADIAVPVPEVSPRPQQRPAPRVAPEPVAAPPPDVAPAPVQQDAVTPEAGGETVAEPQEATAPEEAATEIVTEADRPARAPTSSPRPASRPERVAAPAPTATPAQEPTPAPNVQDAVADALAEALAGAATTAPAPRAPAGPPMSAGERDALRVSVQSCWNVGALSSEAMRTTVTVAVTMGQDARPDVGSIRMLDYAGGSESAARQAFETARRAIIRCGSSGFDLPAEKYDQWREIEMTFNPENMRIR